MHRYYWAAKAVTQLNQILMLNIDERITGAEQAPMRPINARFLDRAGMLEVMRDDIYTDNPHAILESFLIYQQDAGHQGPVSARTLRALYNARKRDGQRHSAAIRLNRELFMDILRQPEGQTHALPADEPDLGAGPLPVGVPAHRRPHATRPVPRLHRGPAHPDGAAQCAPLSSSPNMPTSTPFCSQLAANWDKPWLLYIAALFHDVAKGRGGDHSELGGVEVRRFCRDHGLDKADTGADRVPGPPSPDHEPGGPEGRPV